MATESSKHGKPSTSSRRRARARSALTYDADAAALEQTRLRRAAGHIVCDVDRMCCNVASDGGFSAPLFNSGGDPYREPKSVGSMFARPAGAFRAGSSRKLLKRRPGASALQSDPEAVKAALPKARTGGLRSGKGGALFAPPGLLGPSDGSLKALPRGAGGGFRVGKSAGFTKYDRMNDSMFPAKKKEAPYDGFVQPAFKRGNPGNADFFDPSMCMSGNDERPETPKRGTLDGKPWKPSGCKTKPMGKYPTHSYDDYDAKPSPGAGARQNGRMRMGARHGRTGPPIKWDKIPTVDVYRTRNEKSMASMTGGLGSTLNTTTFNPSLSMTY